MSELTKRIEHKLWMMNKKRADMVRATNINESTIRSWQDGRSPSAEALVKVADFLGCSVNYLVTGEEVRGIDTDFDGSPKVIEFPDRIQNLIDISSKLNEDDREVVISVADALLSHY